MNPWSEKESKDREAKFLKAYEEIAKRYDYKLMAFPQFIPSGQQGFNITSGMIPVDLRDKNVPSPLQKEDIIK